MTAARFPRPRGPVPVLPSPLPQEERVNPVTPVKVTGAFFQELPPNQLTYYKRIFVAQMPKPLIPVKGANSYPYKLTIVNLKMVERQVLVIKDVSFTAYRTSQIDPSDIIPLSPLENKRLMNAVGYSFAVDGRGFLDYSSNILTPTATAGNPTTKGNPASGSGGSPPGGLIPFQGSIREGIPQFASYARPGVIVTADVWLVRPPPIELAQFTVDISGYYMGETYFDSIVRANVQ